jgi:hypothetical protein
MDYRPVTMGPESEQEIRQGLLLPKSLYYSHLPYFAGASGPAESADSR